MQQAKKLEFGDLVYDLGNRTVNGVELTDKEAGILEILMKNTDVATTKTQILARVWGADSEFDENYVEVYMSYLRRKLKDMKSKTQIKTIRGLGYKLCFQN